MINVKLKGLDRMQKALEQLSKQAVPAAARDALNSMAFEGRKLWQAEMRQTLTMRNTFTERRILVERATGATMDRMQASLGHVEDYVRRTEFGEPEQAAHEWRPIPTESAAGQARGSLRGGRKRPVRASNIISRLGPIKGRPTGAPRKAANARAIRRALKSGRKLALLDMGRRKGIYRLMGGKRRPLITKLYDLSRRSTPRPKTPTLERTLARVARMAPDIAYRAMARQFARLRLK